MLLALAPAACFVGQKSHRKRCYQLEVSTKTWEGLEDVGFFDPFYPWFFLVPEPKNGWIFHELFKLHSVRYTFQLWSKTLRIQSFWNGMSLLLKDPDVKLCIMFFYEMKSDNFVPLLNTSQSKENLKS